MRVFVLTVGADDDEDFFLFVDHILRRLGVIQGQFLDLCFVSPWFCWYHHVQSIPKLCTPFCTDGWLTA